MATAKPKKESTSRALANWDEELAKQAQISADQEASTATGQFFGLKAGVLTFNGNPLPNNEMAVVILDSVLENVYYGGQYDPDSPQSPMCFAFGRDDKEMKPHTIVIENKTDQAGASGLCSGCQFNEFGSAETGRGKACRNTRRLAMIPAGTLENGKFKAYDEEQLTSAGIAYMKLPVTSVKGYAAFVKQITGVLRRPPHGIFTKVKVIPDAQSQFKVTFEPLTSVPNDLMAAVMERHKEAQAAIEFPYSPYEEPEAKPARGKAQKAAKPAPRRKY